VAVICNTDIQHSPLVTLTGEVDIIGSGHIADVLTELLEVSQCSPKIDMTGVSYMDSTGLLTVLRWCQQFRRNERDLEVAFINPLVRRLFEIAGENDLINRSEERTAPPPMSRQPITDCFAVAGDCEIRSFSVAARLDCCKVVRDKISQTLASMPFDNSERDDVKLAVGEAVSNAIKHGCSERPWEIITVRSLATSQKIVVEISDDGPGFDPESIDQTERDWTMMEGRMGIKCIQRSMDEVSFDFSSGTTIRMVKYVKSYKL